MRYLFLTVALAIPLAAQWVKYPTAGVPRKADAKVDLSAAAPRLPNGKPDFSGIWATGEPDNRPPSPVEPIDAGDIRASRQMANIGVDLPGGLPYQPWQVPIWLKTTRTSNVCRTTSFARMGCRIF